MFILSLLLSIASCAFANDDSKHSFQVWGFDMYKFDYKEDLIAPQKSTKNGWLNGVYVDYIMHERNDIYLNAVMGVAKADLTYDGSTQDGELLAFSINNPQEFYSFQGRVGINRALADDV